MFEVLSKGKTRRDRGRPFRESTPSNGLDSGYQGPKLQALDQGLRASLDELTRSKPLASRLRHTVLDGTCQRVQNGLVGHYGGRKIRLFGARPLGHGRGDVGRRCDFRLSHFTTVCERRVGPKVKAQPLAPRSAGTVRGITNALSVSRCACQRTVVTDRCTSQHRASPAAQLSVAVTGP